MIDAAAAKHFYIFTFFFLVAIARALLEIVGAHGVIYFNLISIKSIHELNIVEQSNASFSNARKDNENVFDNFNQLKLFELQSEQMSLESLEIEIYSGRAIQLTLTLEYLRGGL